MGEGPGVRGLDGPGRAAEGLGGGLDVEVEPVPEHDDGPLLRRQPGQRGHHRVAQRGVGRIRDGGPRVGGLGLRSLPAPVGPPGLVDERVGQHPVGVAHGVVGSLHLRPCDVDLGQRRLHEVLGERLVADGQQPGGAQQPRPLSGDEGRELRVAIGWSAPGLPSLVHGLSPP